MSRSTQVEFNGSLLNATKAITAIEEQTDLVFSDAELVPGTDGTKVLHIKMKTKTVPNVCKNNNGLLKKLKGSETTTKQSLNTSLAGKVKLNPYYKSILSKLMKAFNIALAFGMVYITYNASIRAFCRFCIWLSEL